MSAIYEIIDPSSAADKAELHLLPAVTPELSEDPMVTRNLAMMTGKEMDEVMSAESFGGNAGSVEIDGEHISCAAVNGYADKSTGAITVFGNIQDIDKETVERYGEFTFIVAPSRRTFETRIVNMIAHKGLTEEGVGRLQQSVDIYNEQAPERAMQQIAELKREYGSAVMRVTGF